MTLRFFVVGGNGRIGKAICAHIAHDEYEAHKLVSTTRRSTSNPNSGIFHLDLLKPRIPNEFFHIAFICAGVNGFKNCAENPIDSWRINVDGVIEVAMRLIKRGTFVVYPSTQAVEWSKENLEWSKGTEYAMQRRQVEAVLLATWNAAIVRVGRVTAANSAACAKALVNIGLLRDPGVFQWP